MKINAFKNKLYKLISKAEEILEEMPQKGNTSNECQKLNLQQALNEFQYCVNGTTQKDLELNQEDE